MERQMDEDLIVLGAPAETQAAGGETSNAEPQTEGHAAGGEASPAAPGSEQAAPTDASKPEAPKGEGEDGGEEKPKRPSGSQRYKDTIARLKAENESLRSAAPAAGADRTSAIEKEIGAPPKETDFEGDYFAWERAQRQYDVKYALAEQRAHDREAAATRQQAAAREEAVDAFNDRVEEIRTKLPDFDKVVSKLKADDYSPQMRELVIESEKGPELAYYFGGKPEELARLNRMGPLAAAKAVGALEARLTLAKPRTATAAPAPAKPVSGAAAPGPDPSKMSMDEYVKWRSGAKG